VGCNGNERRNNNKKFLNKHRVVLVISHILQIDILHVCRKKKCQYHFLSFPRLFHINVPMRYKDFLTNKSPFMNIYKIQVQRCNCGNIIEQTRRKTNRYKVREMGFPQG
jgi:hypothetical protein